MTPDLEAAHADRRHFLRLLGLAGLGVMTAADGVLAQGGSAGGAPGAKPGEASAKPAPPAAAPATQPISEDARAVTGVLQRRYPDRLTAEQWESVMRDVDGDLASGKRLREAKLVNADEPDVMFRA